mgnify:FL=1
MQTRLRCNTFTQCITDLNFRLKQGAITHNLQADTDNNLSHK